VLKPTWWPSTPQWQNFVTMWEATNFGAALWNSIYVAVLSTLLSLVVSIPAAYALSRFRFVGKGFVQQFLLVSQMLSPIVLYGLFRLLVASSLDSLNAVALSTLRSTSPRSGCCRATDHPRTRGSRLMEGATPWQARAGACRWRFPPWWSPPFSFINA
jgi:ABC-type glycerol-3-phosphate transport system permease component